MTAGARHYLIVTASYWGFTLIDGALRMLVLLHFFRLGYSPFTLAFLFLLYEVAGIVANLERRLARDALRHPAHAGGRAGAADRRPRHALGCSIRPGARLPRSPGWWRRRASRASPRTSPRPRRNRRSRRPSAEGAGQLFRWVAWFTGSKNAMKGIGFFVGGLLLEVAGLPRRAVADGGAARASSSLAGLLFAAARSSARPSRPRRMRGAVRQVARRQPAGRRAHLHVRRARRLVRRRPAGLPLRRRLDASSRSAASSPPGRSATALIQAVAPSLVTRSADGLEPRDSRGAAVGRRCWPPCRSCWRCCCRRRTCGGPIIVLVGGLALFGVAVRGQLLAAFLSDPGLCRLGEGGRGCRLLLCRQCRRPADRHPAVGRCSIRSAASTACLIGSAVMLTDLLADHASCCRPARAIGRAAPATRPEETVNVQPFERYLTLWVALCIVAGVALGHLMPPALPGHRRGRGRQRQSAGRCADLADDHAHAAEDRLRRARPACGEHWRGIGVTLVHQLGGQAVLDGAARLVLHRLSVPALAAGRTRSTATSPA